MEGRPPNDPDLFLHIPFSKRWEAHKATICRLYRDEERSVEDVANVMKCQYRFDARYAYCDFNPLTLVSVLKVI
jgi:hypothetical protein